MKFIKAKDSFIDQDDGQYVAPNKKGRQTPLEINEKAQQSIRRRRARTNSEELIGLARFYLKSKSVQDFIEWLDISYSRYRNLRTSGGVFTDQEYNKIKELLESHDEEVPPKVRGFSFE